MKTTELKLQALANHLGLEVVELHISSYDDCIIEYGSEEYLVVTDEEADEKWENELDWYLEECIYPELPDSIRNYFDDDKWKRDARLADRAHSLAKYDGYENSENIENETFYIYRIN